MSSTTLRGKRRSVTRTQSVLATPKTVYKTRSNVSVTIDETSDFVFVEKGNEGEHVQEVDESRLSSVAYETVLKANTAAAAKFESLKKKHHMTNFTVEMETKKTGLKKWSWSYTDNDCDGRAFTCKGFVRSEAVDIIEQSGKIFMECSLEIS